MNDSKASRDDVAKQLRVKLVGKPLVGFDTRRWATLGTDATAKGRVGGKATFGGKFAPARI